MSKYSCPNSKCLSRVQTNSGSNFVLNGFYSRPSDGRKIQRFRCKFCGKNYSKATFHPAYRQNKRRVNYKLKKLLCSGVSQRRCAFHLNINKVTVARKLRFLAAQAKISHQKFLKRRRKFTNIQFDDLITIEHTKCKPLSVSLAVEANTRIIIGLEVSSMPANGNLAHFSRLKYGPRKDERQQGLDKLFREFGKKVSPKAQFSSDEHPFYPRVVKKYFPDSDHKRFKGGRGCITGQGELKKLKFDPLFDLNHTCAMLRANINRLFRRTWCTTKDPQRLHDHLMLYVNFHNRYLVA